MRRGLTGSAECNFDAVTNIKMPEVRGDVKTLKLNLCCIWNTATVRGERRSVHSGLAEGRRDDRYNVVYHVVLQADGRELSVDRQNVIER